MQNKIHIFENQEFGQVRVIHIGGQPWWVLKDVCAVLGIKNHKMTAQRLDGDEVSLADLIDNLGRTQKTAIISESGLYAVILRSDKPNARAFRKWVTSEILPTIRKHGAYIHEDILQKMRESEEFAETLMGCLEYERTKSKSYAALIRQDAPKVRYYDTILQCPEAVQVSIIAKDYGMSAIAFNKLLYKLGVQFRMGNTWLLYRKHTGNGYTITRTYEIDGRLASIHTCWTQRGRFWLYDLLKSHGILPEAEKVAACS